MQDGKKHTPKTREKIREGIKNRWDLRSPEQRMGISERQSRAQEIYGRGYTNDRVQCQKCVFWFPIDRENSQQQGECIRYPPSAGGHLIVSFDAICGEFIEIVVPNESARNTLVEYQGSAANTAIGLR